MKTVAEHEISCRAVLVPSPSRCTPKQCFVLLNRRTKNILVVLATTSMQHANVQDDQKVPCRYSFLFLVDLIINHNWITVTARELQLQNWNPFEIFWICCPSQMLLNYRRISYSWLRAFIHSHKIITSFFCLLIAHLHVPYEGGYSLCLPSLPPSHKYLTPPLSH